MNLNIDDYDIDELRDLLSLPGDFTSQSVDTAKKKLEVQLTQKQDMDAEEKRRITFFLDSAADRLRNVQTQVHTTALDKHASPKDAAAKKKADSKKAGTWAETIVPTSQYGSNIIVENPNTIVGRNAKIVDGRAAMSGDAPPGYINPINVRTIMQGITVDSRFRKDYFGTSSSKFSVELPHIQRKCVTMRVASIEMPMTYYAISEAQGNNTFIIACNYDMAQLEGSRPELLTGNGSGFVHPTAPDLPQMVPQYNYNFDWLPAQTSNSPATGNNTSPNTPWNTLGGCIRFYPITLAMLTPLLPPSFEGYFPPGATEHFKQFHNSGMAGDKVPAWRVKIPDGNYELRFSGANEGEVIENAVNNAIALAEPGWLDQESGFAQFHACKDNISGWSNSDASANLARLRPNRDICFTVNHASGKGIFAAPDLSGVNMPQDLGLIDGSHNFPFTPPRGSKFENHGFFIRWPVDTTGDLDMETSTQLRFGWQLGFRASQYVCGGVAYTPRWTPHPLGGEWWGSDPPGTWGTSPVSQTTVGSTVSEGVTLITGPRYCFLAIDDHKTSTSPAMLVAYANSTLDDNIISRINLTSIMDSTHVYKYADDPRANNTAQSTA